jgi:hypothetical protein
MRNRGDRRREHAERVRGVAAGMIDETSDPLRPDAFTDRDDLLQLLIAIGETWLAAVDSPVSLEEQMRWSRVCVLAQQIADRKAAEAEELRAMNDRKPWNILRIPRVPR